MLVEDAKQPPHTLLQSDAWDPNAVVNMPAMHTKDQAVSVMQCFYNMTHRHPGVRSPPSLSPLVAFLFDSSSSSTTSCGLIVMCTTFAVSALNRHSIEMISQR